MATRRPGAGVGRARSECADPELLWLLRQACGDCYRCVRMDFSPDAARLFSLVDIQGRSLGAAARQLGIDPDQARSLLAKVRLAVVACMTGCGPHSCAVPAD